MFLRNYTGKGRADDAKSVAELADYVCYWLQERGHAVVRKNLEAKNRKKTKRAPQNDSRVDLATVSTLIETPPLAFLKN
jgi:hypothetical protein